PAGGPGVVGQVLDDVIDGVVVVVDDVHDGHGGDVARLKDGVAVGVDDGIVAVHLGVDELLHDVGGKGVHRRFVGQEVPQLLVGGQLVGVRGAHAVVRLDHHGVAHLVDELAAAVEVVHHVVTGGGDAGLLVIGLHLALVLDAGDVLDVEAGGDVEVGPQAGVLLQPVLVVGLQPVDLAVREGEEGHRAVDLVVGFQAADLVVFVQARVRLRHQLVVRLVADAQHAHPVVFQLMAERPVVGGEARGDEDKVFHTDSSRFHVWPGGAAQGPSGRIHWARAAAGPGKGPSGRQPS